MLIHPLAERLRGLGMAAMADAFVEMQTTAADLTRDDLVLLAHVRSAFARSNETDGSPRLTRELQDQGLSVGRRRLLAALRPVSPGDRFAMARLMRENGLKARRPQRFKRTTDSLHAFPVVSLRETPRSRPTFPSRTLPPSGPTRNGLLTSPVSGHVRAGCISPSSSICSPGAWSAGPSATGCTRSQRWLHCDEPLLSDGLRPT